MAETIEGAPKIAAIPAATPIIKPQETLPVKKPIPIEIIAKAAKALPALPVTTLITLHIVLLRMLSSTPSDIIVTDVVAASESLDINGAATGTTVTIKNDNKKIFAREGMISFIKDGKI